MASKKQISIAPPPLGLRALPTAPLSVPFALLSYDARDWSNEITLLDGSKPGIRHYGILTSDYPTIEGAQYAGIEWALKQLKDRLWTYDPPLNNEEEFDAEFNAWQKSSSEQGDTWSYTVSKGDETLVVIVTTWSEVDSFTLTTKIRESWQQKD